VQVGVDCSGFVMMFVSFAALLHYLEVKTVCLTVAISSVELYAGEQAGGQSFDVLLPPISLTVYRLLIVALQGFTLDSSLDYKDGNESSHESPSVTDGNL
jgi:hypothetical protein